MLIIFSVDINDQHSRKEGSTETTSTTIQTEQKAELESILSSGTLPFDKLEDASKRIGAIIQETDEKEFRWLELTDGL